MNPPVLLARFRVMHGAKIALGPGKAGLLALIEETGSLTETAKRLGMSYMRAWTLVQTMNECFREPVVVTERGGRHGGGMKLSKSGRRALALYQELEAEALSATKTSWLDLQKLLRPGSPAPSTCGPAN